MMDEWVDGWVNGWLNVWAIDEWTVDKVDG